MSANTVSFADLEFTHWLRGMTARIHFPNGYGASVIMGPSSYGGDQLLYELGVLKDGRLCYDTPIADNVIGYLTPDMVTELLQKIQGLEKPDGV